MRHKKHGNTQSVAVLFAYPKNRHKAFAPVKLVPLYDAPHHSKICTASWLPLTREA